MKQEKHLTVWERTLDTPGAGAPADDVWPVWERTLDTPVVNRLMSLFAYVFYFACLPVDLLAGTLFRCFGRFRRDAPEGIEWAVIPGCGYMPPEEINERLDAALRLYDRCPRLRFFLSGTERPGTDYSEPRYMADYLAARGIPPERILRDGEGYNTRLTFVNAKKQGIGRCMVLSNDFHLPRCVDTARRLGLDAYAYRVPFVNLLSHPYRWRYWVREKLALYWGYLRSLTGGG